MTSSMVNESLDESDGSEGSEDSDDLVAAYRARIAKACCYICVLILVYISVDIVC